MFFWGRRPDVADALARSFGGVYRLLLNKYYVDEIYDAAIVQPIKRLSTGALWKGVDAGLIDGTVNGVGALVRGASGGAAAAADRVGPRVCGVALPRRRHDSWLVSVDLRPRLGHRD